MNKLLRIVALVLFVSFAWASDVGPTGPLVIRIRGGIDGSTLNQVEETLAKRKPNQPIVVQINSPGGEVGAGLFIIRAIREAGGATCEVQDIAASMAAIIFESPACNERIVEPNSILMWHGISGGAEGNTSKHESHVLSMRVVERALAEMIAPRMGLTVDQYLEATSGGREVWVTGRGAYEREWADKMKQ